MEFNAWTGAWGGVFLGSAEVRKMILSGLVSSAMQVDPSVGWAVFFGGIILLVGILYYFAKHTK